MNTIILYATSVLSKTQITTLRLVSVTALSSLYSTVMFFPQLSVLYTGVFKLLFLILFSHLAFPSRIPKVILKKALIFLATNFIFGGTVFFLIFFTSFGTAVGAIISNGEIYLDISFGTLAVSTLLAFGIVTFISFIRKQNEHNTKTTAKVTICLDKKSIHGTALWDTGCNLSDPLTGTPAIVISPTLANKLLPSKFPYTNFRIRYRMLPYTTLESQKNFLHGFVSDRILINNTEFKNTVVGIAKTDLSEYDAILNCAFAENNTFRKAGNIYDDIKTTF